MIFGPDFNILARAVLWTLPIALLCCVAALWAWTWWLVPKTRWWRCLLTVLLQWGLIAALPILFGWLTSRMSPPDGLSVGFLALELALMPVALVGAAMGCLPATLGRACAVVGLQCATALPLCLGALLAVLSLC